MTMRRTSARQAFGVVADDLIRGTPVADATPRATPGDLSQRVPALLARNRATQTVEPLSNSSSDSHRDAFARLCRKFASQPVRRLILDVQSHLPGRIQDCFRLLVPARKTDVKDAEWLCQLAEPGGRCLTR